MHSADPDNPRLRNLVRDLTGHSRDFTRLWNTHAVRGKTWYEGCRPPAVRFPAQPDLRKPQGGRT
ncbi:hypothetical protein ACFW6F_39410 [Streptomyces sp. NPDC058746]|uniref:MmyB family transcriptional regulator n=1 Tax=Streptomyces sp. NPDC058746 TaxID=3346622 RepID=UPI00369205CC